MDNFNSDFSDKKKINFDFKKKKDNTIKSLNDVEQFLRGFRRAVNYIKVYKLFKK